MNNNPIICSLQRGPEAQARLNPSRIEFKIYLTEQLYYYNNFNTS